jgi:tetratricopeptide (TPR) repeat protein
MEEARAVFRKTIDEMPSDAALWCNYRATYLHEENYQAALPYFEKAIELSPAFHVRTSPPGCACLLLDYMKMLFGCTTGR